MQDSTTRLNNPCEFPASQREAVPLSAVPEASGRDGRRKSDDGTNGFGTLEAAAYEISVEALVAPALDDLLPRVAEAASDALAVDYCEVLEYQDSESEQRLALRAGAGFSPEILGNTSVGVRLESQAGYTLLRGEPVMVNDLATEERFNVPALLRDHGVVSGVTVPICLEPVAKRQERRAQSGHLDDEAGCFGVLGVHCTSAREFTTAEIRFLVQMASIVAGAWERQKRERNVGRELRSVSERAERLESYLSFETEVLETLAGIPDRRAIAEWAAHMAVPYLADWCMIDLLEDPNESGSGTGGMMHLATRSARPRPRVAGWWRVRRAAVAHPPGARQEQAAEQMLGDYPIDATSRFGTPKILRSGRTQYITDLDDEVLEELAANDRAPECLGTLDARSYIGVPLKRNGDKIGVIGFVRSAQSGTGAGHFGPEDVERAERFALIVANALVHYPQPIAAPEVAAAETTGEEPGSERSLKEAGRLNAERSDLIEVLTEQQSLVFELAGEGKTNRQIAKELHLAQSTIRTHVGRACTALGIVEGGRQELVRRAIRYFRSQ